MDNFVLIVTLAESGEVLLDTGQGVPIRRKVAKSRGLD